jgi:hypothetical protein
MMKDSESLVKIDTTFKIYDAEEFCMYAVCTAADYFYRFQFTAFFIKYTISGVISLPSLETVADKTWRVGILLCKVTLPR